MAGFEVSTEAEEGHREIYRVLQIPHQVMKPVKTWTTSSDATRA